MAATRFAILWLFMAAAAVFGADPVIGTVSISPTFTPPSTAAQVTITALITDPNLLLNGANVQRLSATGAATGVLGILHDDGINGDAVAGDHIYTLVFSVNEAASGRIPFRVTGAFRGVLQRVASSSVALDIATAASPLSIAATAAPAPNAAGWNKQDVTVTYSCAGGAGGSESCPGIVRVTTEGRGQIISGTATDGAGNSAPKSVTINLDKSAPVINITSPANGATIGTSSLTLTGTANDPLSGIATVTCNGQAGTVSASTFSCNLALVPGANSISVQATDVAGNIAASTLSVTFAPSSLTISAVQSPAPNAAGWNSTDVTVSFTCAGGTGPVTCPAPVLVSTEGANQAISRTATDSVGNTATASITLKIDKTKPVVAITSPAAGSTVTAPALTLTGTASDALSGIAGVTCNGAAATFTAPGYSCQVTLINGSNTITVQATDLAGNVATATVSVTLTPSASPTIGDFTPKSGPIGTLVTISGANLAPAAGTSAQVSMSKQGGGAINAPVATAAATQLIFTIPAGGATGPLAITVNGGGATSAGPFTVTPSADFTMTVLPAAATLIKAQSTAYSVTLASTSGFNQLAELSVAGLPPGVTASFKPQLITAGQTAILTLIAPAAQATGTAALIISANATVDGLPVSQTGPATLNIVAPTTSFIGRTVVDDALQTSLAGVTVSMLGKNGNGGATGCTGTTVSDAAGNFALTGLAATCVGQQLVGFNGLTATSPAGQYAGVNLVYTLTAGQVTTSPVLVHLPRIDNQETFLVTQNSSVDQSYSYSSIPGLSVTVYKNTTFTMPDGTTPNPFPLIAVQVPVDRLPDSKPPVPTMMLVFIVAFQPANANTNQPVAVTYPNSLSTAPGTNMPMMTLDPTRGTMVPYGTGTVSADGTRVVPDLDPAFPGHRYGIVHFDWHGQMPPASPAVNPSAASGGTGPSSGSCGSSPPPAPLPSTCSDNPTTGEPIDLASGLYVSNVTDISLSSPRGTVAIQRIYRTLSNIDGPFGMGSGGIYDYSLDTPNTNTAQAINLINPDGSRFLFSRQPDGSLTNSTVPSLLGAVMTTTPGNQTTLRYKNGASIGFQSYFASTREVSITDSNGNQISITRNPGAPQQITSISDPSGRQLTFTYGSNANHVASITDPIGRVVSYAYNVSGTLASVTDPAGGVTSYFYDAQNRLSRMTDPRGNTVFQNVFDANGRVVQQTQADGGVIQITYELANPTNANSYVKDVTVSDARGNDTFYRFNPQGFLIMAVDPLVQTTTFNRDPGTNLVLSTSGNASCPVCGDPGAGGLTFTYDSQGNILTRTDALGNRTTFTYDPVFGKVTSVRDPLGNTTVFSYDSRGNLLTSTDAKGNVVSFAYDATGLLTQSTDALNQKTKFSYDGSGNLISVIDPLGNTSSYRYDAISRLVETMDALGRRTGFSYDALNRLTARTDAKSGVTQFTYDANGNLLSVRDARNNTTAFTYDFMNRLATRTNALAKTDNRTYDKNGNLTQFVDRRGQTSTFAYDKLNRLIAETYLDAMVTRKYDAYSRLSTVVDTAAGAFTFTYDPVGHLLASSTPVGAVSYTYDNRGATLSRQVVGQPKLVYVYDAVGNLTSAAMPQASTNFSYNARNQLLSLGRLNGVSSAFTYDLGGRLLSINHLKGASVVDVENYAYDQVGNRTSHSTSIGQAIITQPSLNQYNAANQLTQFGSVLNSYDDGGSLLQQGPTATYSWDSRHRLKSIVLASGQVTTFTYDFGGNLISQADAGAQLNRTQSFVLDKLSNVAYQSASDGASYSVLAGQSLDSHLAIIRSNGQVEYGLSDGNNSTVATVDDGGNVKGRFRYEAFGQTSSVGSSYPFQYSGRVPVFAGIYYYRSRFYDSVSSRFLSEDPLGESGGVNLYAYVNGNPVSKVDPLGLFDYEGTALVITGTITAIGAGTAAAGISTPLAAFGVGAAMVYGMTEATFGLVHLLGHAMGTEEPTGLIEGVGNQLFPGHEDLVSAVDIASAIAMGGIGSVLGRLPHGIEMLEHFIHSFEVHQIVGRAVVRRLRSCAVRRH